MQRGYCLENDGASSLYAVFAWHIILDVCVVELAKTSAATTTLAQPMSTPVTTSSLTQRTSTTMQ